MTTTLCALPSEILVPIIHDVLTAVTEQANPADSIQQITRDLSHQADMIYRTHQGLRLALHSAVADSDLLSLRASNRLAHLSDPVQFARQLAIYVGRYNVLYFSMHNLTDQKMALILSVLGQDEVLARISTLGFSIAIRPQLPPEESDGICEPAHQNSALAGMAAINARVARLRTVLNAIDTIAQTGRDDLRIHLDFNRSSHPQQQAVTVPLCYDEAEVIADRLVAQNNKIGAISLSGNRLGSMLSEPVRDLLFDALVQPDCKVTELNLSGNQLDYVALSRSMNHFMACPRITSVDLRHQAQLQDYQQLALEDRAARNASLSQSILV